MKALAQFIGTLPTRIDDRLASIVSIPDDATRKRSVRVTSARPQTLTAARALAAELSLGTRDTGRHSVVVWEP